MDFSLTDEQKLIRQTAREFVDKEVSPFVDEWEERGDIPHAVVRRMGGLGILGAPIPQKYGGLGVDAVTFALITEEMGRGCSSLRTTLSVNTGLCGNTILLAGSEEQRKRWLPKLATAEQRGAWALSEHGSGSDAAGMQTRATKKGNEWVLNGVKMWISDGDIADVVVVFARTFENEDKHKDICAFVVEKGTPGFRPGVVEVKNKLGLRASHTAELLLEDCHVPDANRLGAPGEGWTTINKILNSGRLSVAAGAVGIAQAALDAALKYARTREQFGKPIIRFQLVRAMLAEMQVDVEASRNLVLKAAWMKDTGLDDRLAVSLAKLHAAEMVMRVTEKAVQIHGGVGYTSEFPVERYFRDAKICGIYEGTNEIQKLIIAEEMEERASR